MTTITLSVPVCLKTIECCLLIGEYYYYGLMLLKVDDDEEERMKSKFFLFQIRGDRIK